jgi:class 3 adenylate cyclase
VIGLPGSEREADPRAGDPVVPVEEWVEAVRDAERRGELLAAVDLAEQGLAEYPDDLWLKHRSVLALARAGATGEAAKRFEHYGLPQSQEDEIVALGARIAKDLALAAEGSERTQQATRARDLYAALYGRNRDYYPAINAATLSLLVGEPERARALAAEVIELVRAGDEGSYFAAATEGEAQLLLGDEVRAREALEQAASLHQGDYSALATTRRQLRLVCALADIDPDLLSPLSGPAVVHFCGHRISAAGAPGRFPASAEAEVAARIDAEVASRRPGFAYGALAGGADILWAEALLRHGAELHVVLPFARDEFVASSVAPCGAGWTERFEHCLARATSVTYATDDAFLGDDVLYRHGTELAMGLTLLRARYLDADVRQLAVWDGGGPAGQAGTAIDVGTWRRDGRPATIIQPLPGQTPWQPETVAASGAATGRVVRAMMFADVKGFSKLSDEELPRFTSHMLGAFAAVLDRYGNQVEYRNTWGDALYAVLATSTAAAACALELEDAFKAVDLDAAGLPSHLALRLGAHVGPIFPSYDPVLDRSGFMGSHVSRTARIEPVTPPGEVYVTEPFAAALELDRRHPFACDYVGNLPAAKEYGNLRMYRLHTASSAGAKVSL